MKSGTAPATPSALKAKTSPWKAAFAIADVYDALITDRPYKKAFSHEEACRIIEEGDGTHFDPILVSAFRKVEGEFRQIMNSV